MRNLVWVAVALALGAAGYLLGRAEPDRAATDREPMAAPEEAPAPVEDAPGPVIDGATWVPGDGLDGGTILRFPAGKHGWQSSRLTPFPNDLLVEGAGVDRTLLRIDPIRSDKEIVNLTFRDLTIDCKNHDFTRLSAHATIRLERCRVIRFDNGAGGSVMLNGKSMSFTAVDSRFEGGFGSAPGFGNLFHVRGGLVARLERCTIRGPLRSVYDADRDARYLFRSCAFEDLDESLRREMESPAKGVTFESCRFAFVEKGGREVRPLTDLNPAWTPE